MGAPILRDGLIDRRRLWQTDILRVNPDGRVMRRRQDVWPA